jgi:hypothetical protein
MDLNITECGAIIICCAVDDVICCMARSSELTLGSQDLILEGGQRDQFPWHQCICEQIFRVCEQVMCSAVHLVWEWVRCKGYQQKL